MQRVASPHLLFCRKIHSLVLFVMLLLGSVVAYALDIQYGTEAYRMPPGSNRVGIASASQPWLLPSAYTIYSKDASDAFKVRREFGASGAETYWIDIPAGQSILLPAPEPTKTGSTFYHYLQFAEHSDTLMILPWYE